MNLPRNQAIHGDCLEVMADFPDDSIDLIVTDPPYGIGEAAGKNKSRDKLARAKDYGNKKWDNFRPELDYFRQMQRISKNQIIFGGNYFADILPASSCWIVWDKDNSGDFADCELAWTSFRSAVRKIKWRWNGMLQENMKCKEIRVHPTQKPVPLMTWLLKKYSQPNDIILDPFLGSGTTAIAAINTGRRWIGIEKEAEYVEMARRRIAEHQPLLDYLEGRK